MKQDKSISLNEITGILTFLLIITFIIGVLLNFDKLQNALKEITESQNVTIAILNGTKLYIPVENKVITVFGNDYCPTESTIFNSNSEKGCIILNEGKKAFMVAETKKVELFDIHKVNNNITITNANGNFVTTLSRE